MRYVLALAVVCCYYGTSHAQIWGTVAGYVCDSATQEALPGVAVVVSGTNFGTATNDEGRYQLQLPVGQYPLQFTFLGYAPHADSVVIVADMPSTLTVVLDPAPVEMDPVTVEESSLSDVGVQQLDPEHIRNIPTPFKGFQALSSLAGVASSNELSNQYSVRGGGFNENLIFLNNYEIHMPFRPRQGEQEGLGLLNPDLARSITLHTGGFPARYGGKISSSLDIQYAATDSFRASASISLLDAGLSAAHSHRRLAWLFGVRKARARRFFSTQELKGNYQPDYTDVQGLLRYTITRHTSVELIGVWAKHEFALDPRSRRTFYGSLRGQEETVGLKAVWVNFSDNSQERGGYTTAFAGARLKMQLSTRFQMAHDVALFQTEETERLQLVGNSVIYDVVLDPGGDSALIPRGNAQQEDFADNVVRVTTHTGKGRYQLTTARHAAEIGWRLRRLAFDDRINEHTIVKGASTDGDLVRLVVDSIRGTAALNASQVAFYAQDTYQAAPNLALTGGVRADYFSFNREWTWSPRVFVRLLASDRLTLAGAAGVYHQTPTYRELRGPPKVGQPLDGAADRSVRSQRAFQVVMGGEWFVPARRFYVRAEGYWKQLSNIISYSLENVRIDYSGINDAQGYVYGLDLQARGEFVPGLESWVNYGLLVTRERFLPDYAPPNDTGKWTPRATDQLHTIALYLQDYIPTDQSWKLHMRILFGSGLPYTPPVPGTRVGSVITQVPGDRHSARFPPFRRMDFGATKEISLGFTHLELTAEVLNIFDVTNTVAYAWIPDAIGVWQRVPTRLTPRTFNVRLRASL